MGGPVNFDTLFKPKTLAVIGVSLSNDRHPANVIYTKNNLRFQAEVFPVNERGGILEGETVYSRISDIPRKVDLAVIAVRAEMVPEIIGECIKSAGRISRTGWYPWRGKPTSPLLDLIVLESTPLPIWTPSSFPANEW
jgi:predicted CoA-binding protein